MDRRNFIKALALAGAAVTLKLRGAGDVFAQTAAESAEKPVDLVAVLGGEPDAMFRKAIVALGGMGRFVKRGDKVVVKPNIGWDKAPELAANTNPVRTTQIGNSIWMAENLNHKFGENGVWCLGKNIFGLRDGEDESNCAKYGRLYNWDMAKRACPKGWHLPSEKEWTDLVAYVGSSTAGKKLRAKTGWTGWRKNGHGTDDYGFSAQPGGLRDTAGDSFNEGHSGHWWTATGYGGNAFFREIRGNVDTVGGGYGLEGYGFSVRCVAD